MSKSNIYYCTTAKNTCPEKDTCYRYKELERFPKLPNATLFNIQRGEGGCRFFIQEKEEEKEDAKE